MIKKTKKQKNKKIIITCSEKETFSLAQKFAKILHGGETLLLIGDLGSGKTAFTKGIAKGLGVNKTVTSPTFVLMKNYKTKSKISEFVHIDAYRLNSGKELEDIGVREYFKDENCVTVIEWADRVRDIWPENKIVLEFGVVDENERKIRIK